MYDEEQFRSRFQLTEDGFPDMLNIMAADILLFHSIRTPVLQYNQNSLNLHMQGMTLRRRPTRIAQNL
jgi:hypothetical protein